jgi:hypothetical protein
MPQSESFQLGDHNREIGQRDFSPCLRRLICHELVDAGENGLLHCQDLEVDLPPEERLLQGGGCRISFVVHTERMVPAPDSGDDIRASSAQIIGIHMSVIYRAA